MKWFITHCFLLMWLPTSATSVNAVLMEAQLRDVRFAAFSIEAKPLSEGFDALKKRTTEIFAETTPPNAQAPPFILVPPSTPAGPDTNHPPATISYDGKNVTLETILREIAKSANQDVFLTSSGIVMTPKGLPPFPNPEAEKGEIFRKLTGDGPD